MNIYKLLSGKKNEVYLHAIKFRPKGKRGFYIDAISIRSTNPLEVGGANFPKIKGIKSAKFLNVCLSPICGHRYDEAEEFNKLTIIIVMESVH